MDDRLQLQKLAEVFYAIYHGKYGLQIIRQNQEYIDRSKPADVIRLVDKLVKNGVPMAALKKGINKFLGILNKPLLNLDIHPPVPGSFLECCILNNTELDQRLKNIRPLIKKINRDPRDVPVREELARSFSELERYGDYYQILENTLFPLVEKHWKDHNCVKVMGSYHDDIRKNLKQVVSLLTGDHFDLPRLNRYAGDLFFDMYAMRFREERILFPVVRETLPAEEVDALLREVTGTGFPYFNPELETEIAEIGMNVDEELINLRSGLLSAEQIILIFRHLPVDITFVDEYDKVRFFSDPEKRIFPRNNAVLGRDVRNCHPPESLEIVENILTEFRNGRQKEASFRIHSKGMTLVIRYFALFDPAGLYRGVLEVSQAVTEIFTMEGKRRLPDWSV